jgi:hypothetical protein
MSSNALLCAIRTMGYNGKMTGHGFVDLHLQPYMSKVICMMRLKFN